MNLICATYVFIEEKITGETTNSTRYYLSSVTAKKPSEPSDIYNPTTNPCT